MPSDTLGQVLGICQSNSRSHCIKEAVPNALLRFVSLFYPATKNVFTPLREKGEECPISLCHNSYWFLMCYCWGDRWSTYPAYSRFSECEMYVLMPEALLLIECISYCYMLLMSLLMAQWLLPVGPLRKSIITFPLYQSLPSNKIGKKANSYDISPDNPWFLANRDQEEAKLMQIYGTHLQSIQLKQWHFKFSEPKYIAKSWFLKEMTLDEDRSLM